jgi:hypothetical protein
MGRRSRQRTSTGTAPLRALDPPAEPRPAAPSRRSRRAGAPGPPSAPPPRRRRDGAPQAPWGSFPLVELCALAAIVLGIWGILRGGRGGGVLLTAAALLGSVAGLEVAIREHLGGFRSHTLVLSGTVAVATLAILYFADAGRDTMIPVALVALAAALVGFRTLFKRRSGGVSMRVR